MRKINLSKDIEELHIPVNFNSPETAKSAFLKAATELVNSGAELLSLEVFAPKWAEDAVTEFSNGLGNPKFLLNWICPLDESAAPILSGAYICAIKGAKIDFKKTDAGNLSAYFETPEADYCKCFGVLAPLGNGCEYEHTRSNLAELEACLAPFGFRYNDIVRTWFYNDDILAWYDSFNKARTEFYAERGIFDGLLPASTGIGAPNPANKKITSGALAIRVKSAVSAKEIESPLQCGAPKYGSSFSRAVEISTPCSSRITISGTASIESGGKTAHLDDIKAQVELTMRVIEEILKSRGMSFADTTRSIVYCLRPEYYQYFQAWMKEKALDMPHCPAFSIVCRHDLLFEVELDAAKNK